MTSKQALMDLRDKVAAGDQRISSLLPYEYEPHWSKFHLAMDGSLDAAFALHNAVLPGWRWEGGSGAGIFAVWDKPDDAHKGRNDTPARAWLLAILSALIAECGE